MQADDLQMERLLDAHTGARDSRDALSPPGADETGRLDLAGHRPLREQRAGKGLLRPPELLFRVAINSRCLSRNDGGVAREEVLPGAPLKARLVRLLYS